MVRVRSVSEACQNPEARLLKKVNRRIGFSAKSISYIDTAQESIIGLKSYQFCIENLTFNIMIYILVFIEIDHDFILRTDALGPCSDHSLGPCRAEGKLTAASPAECASNVS